MVRGTVRGVRVALNISQCEKPVLPLAEMVFVPYIVKGKAGSLFGR